jgi:hypothetical protein
MTLKGQQMTLKGKTNAFKGAAYSIIYITRFLQNMWGIFID